MAVDIIARALAGQLIGEDGKILDDKLSGFAEDRLTEYHVGGIPIGVSLEGKSWQEIFTMMLYGVLKPELIDPSLSVEYEPKVGQVGTQVTVTGIMNFDRGTITPPFDTSGFRSGLPTSYVVNDTTTSTSELRFPFTFTTGLLDFGDNAYITKVNHAIGEQPKDAAGQDYDSPYPAGYIQESIIIEGVMPVFVSGNGTGDLEPINIPASYFNTPEEGAGFEFIVPGEVVGEGKQIVAIDKRVEIIGVQQYDVMNERWDWIFGDPESSLTAFTITEVQMMVAGEQVIYNAYENALDLVGERRLRFFITEPQA